MFVKSVLFNILMFLKKTIISYAKAKFRRRILHMSRIEWEKPSVLPHVKYGVWTGYNSI